MFIHPTDKEGQRGNRLRTIKVRLKSGPLSLMFSLVLTQWHVECLRFLQMQWGSWRRP